MGGGDRLTAILDAIWPLAERIGVLRRWLNGIIINRLANSTRPRPLPNSLWGPAANPLPPLSASQADSAGFVSWGGLTDRGFTGRHLPPMSPADAERLPDLARIGPLFARRPGGMVPCPRSSALFCFFAQWFTDSFLRTDPTDLRRNTSNHEIDLCQIYGLCAADTRLLRAGRDGLMTMRETATGAYPPLLFDEAGEKVRPEFLGLSYIDAATGCYLHPALPNEFNTPERRWSLHAVGLERGNSTMVYSALNTLFLREHNRLAALIAAELDTDDDDMIFEHARNTNIAQLLRIIVSDYINHISGTRFRFNVEIGFAEKQPWYRANRMSAEFDILYRWHPLVPDAFVLGGTPLASADFRFNNRLLEREGAEAILLAASGQHAGRIMLHNTASFLVEADLAAMTKSRAWRLKPYNDYRVCFGLDRVASMEELTGDRDLADELAAIYPGGVDQVELLVGLFAERRGRKDVLGSLMTYMVGSDAFSQALTNPLLSANVYGPDLFTRPGMACLEQTNRLDDIARRNGMTADKVSFAIS
ncbi:MAG: peroxidase family protein [Sphingomonas sp.]